MLCTLTLCWCPWLTVTYIMEVLICNIASVFEVIADMSIVLVLNDIGPCKENVIECLTFSGSFLPKTYLLCQLKSLKQCLLIGFILIIDCDRLAALPPCPPTMDVLWCPCVCSGSFVQFMLL